MASVHQALSGRATECPEGCVVGLLGLFRLINARPAANIEISLIMLTRTGFWQATHSPDVPLDEQYLNTLATREESHAIPCLNLLCGRVRLLRGFSGPCAHASQGFRVVLQGTGESAREGGISYIWVNAYSQVLIKHDHRDR